MGTKNNPGEFDCYENAEPDEPMFILLARDAGSPRLVRNWAINRLAEGYRNYPKLVEAFKCADAMEDYRCNKIAKELEISE